MSRATREDAIVPEAAAATDYEELRSVPGRSNGDDFGREASFPIMCEIGRVTISKPGTGEHPIMAAFRTIYEYDSPGRFSFPDGFGDHIGVIVPARPTD